MPNPSAWPLCALPVDSITLTVEQYRRTSIEIVAKSKNDT